MNFWKKVAATAFALTIIGGTMPAVTGGAALFRPEISADAAGTVSYDSASKTLTISGSFTKEEIWNYADAEQVIVADNTVFPSNCQSLFTSFSKMTKFKLGNVNTSKVTNMNSMFSGCHSLATLDLSRFDTRNVIDMSFMFSGCASLETLDLSHFNTSKVEDMSFMFSDCSSLTLPNLSSFDTSKVKSMSYMFRGCAAITSVDVSNFDTSSVTDMSYMFNRCYALTSLDLSNFDTSNVTDMNNMFSKCYVLSDLEISDFDTSCVTDMSYMFYYCHQLTKLDLGNFVTKSVDDMNYMFTGCNKLAFLNIVSFNTANVDGMLCMFEDCSSLTSLDLSSFDTKKVKYMNSMFHGDEKLETIYAGGKWDTSAVIKSPDMFAGCSSLVGDSGTVVDSQHTDKEFARIDSADSKGYFKKNPISSVSLTLSDSLGVNFYVGNANDDNAKNYKIVFSGKCAEKGKDLTLAKKDGAYSVTANVSANNMGETITASVYYKDGSEYKLIGTKCYSVNVYLNAINTNEATLQKLVDTIKQYGRVSKAYFSERRIPAVSDNAADINEIANIAPSFDSNDAKLTLVLNSKLAARLYIPGLSAGEKDDKNKYTAVEGYNGEACFEFKEITPTQLTRQYSITYGGKEYRFLPMSWAYRVVANPSSSRSNKAMANILYEYYRDTQAFVKYYSTHPETQNQ